MLLLILGLEKKLICFWYLSTPCGVVYATVFIKCVRGQSAKIFLYFNVNACSLQNKPYNIISFLSSSRSKTLTVRSTSGLLVCNMISLNFSLKFYLTWNSRYPFSYIQKSPGSPTQPSFLTIIANT